LKKAAARDSTEGGVLPAGPAAVAATELRAMLAVRKTAQVVREERCGG